MVLKLLDADGHELAVWEWCKNVWYWNWKCLKKSTGKFENDVKTYGTETIQTHGSNFATFENDVKTYGTETVQCQEKAAIAFENDVKTYGTETV